MVGLPGQAQDPTVLTYPFGMIFEGVNSESFEIRPQPSAGLDRFQIPSHNKEVISQAKELFLSNPSVPGDIDPLTFCLLQGLTHLLPSFRSFPRIPIRSLLKRPTNPCGILIVEDEAEQLELFRLFLEMTGYSNIFLAQDGTEALPILKARGSEIDLIILNWAMPRMDGLTLLGHLRRDYPHPVGVIMQSGYPHNDYKAEFFRHGTNSIMAIDYLVKPFLLEEFTLEVNVAMEYVRRKKLRQASRF